MLCSFLLAGWANIARLQSIFPAPPSSRFKFKFKFSKDLWCQRMPLVHAFLRVQGVSVSNGHEDTNSVL